MTLDNKSILRKSLDDVTRIKKRQSYAFVLLLLLGLIAIAWLGHLSTSPDIDVKKMLLEAVLCLFFLMTYVAMAIAIVITKMTTKVLSAIDLMSNE